MDIHRAGPVASRTLAAPPDHTLALPWNSGTNTLLLALVALLLLVWLLLHRLVRRQGGFRRARRKLAQETRLTARAFTDPLWEFLRFRAAVRRLNRGLAAGGPASLARHALDHADDSVRPAAPHAHGFAAAVRPRTRRDDGAVSVYLAGREVPPCEPPWRSDGSPLLRYVSVADAEELAADAGELAAAAGDVPATPRILVPLGLADNGVVFLDLLRGPRVLSLCGDRRPARSFAQAVAAYLDLRDGDAEVIVTRGVHPRYDGPGLDTVLDALARRGDGPARPVVVVCAAPDEAQAARLARLTADGPACAVVAGEFAAHSWAVRVDSHGRAEAPGLGIATDAAPLGPAVARSVRSARSARSARPPRPARSARGAGEQRKSVAPAVADGAARRPGPPRRAANPSERPLGRTPVRTTAPRAAEPPAPAVRDLFAEPDATAVPAAGSDGESARHHRNERPKES